MKQNKRLLILGTSLLGPEVLDLINACGDYTVTAFVENLDRNKIGTEILGIPVIWIDQAKEHRHDHHCVCALGTTHRHNYVNQAQAMGLQFTSVIHPSAEISQTSKVGSGCIISTGVIVASNTEIGNHVFVNRGSLIGHDTKIKDYVTVSPGANIAGVVTVNECAYIGIGAIILDRLTIGQHAVVGAGAVVTKHVPDRVLVVGIPAKIVKTDIEGR